MPRTKTPKRALHGVLLLDKPLGLSSNDALQKVKWLLKAEKAGHTGTLDPLATGVLPLCFGAATKFSQLHLDANKTYRAIAKLGQKTSTGDAEGEIISERFVPVLSAIQLEAIARDLTGAITQIPPMHSALKKDGKALYEYARAGIEIERAARQIEIFSLKIADVSATHGFAAIQIDVTCSKGTYIRTLAEDIGEMLGCGAHLIFLRRTQTGDFDLSQTISLSDLEALDENNRLKHLQNVQCLLSRHQQIELDEENAARFLSGLRRRGDWSDAPLVAVFGKSPKALLGTAQIKSGELIPARLLNPLEIEQMLGFSYNN